MNDRSNPVFNALRVSLREPDVRELQRAFPLLTRTEICDVIQREGPLRSAVEAELDRLSSRKR